METISKYKWPLMVVLVMSFCALLFFSLYFCDVKALTDFSRAYTKYDRAISDWSASFAGSAPEGAPGTDALERKVESAFFELKADASERISSLIKHNEEFMRIEQEIAELSGKEREAISAYKWAIIGKEADAESLTEEFRDLKNRRTATYTRFQQLVQLTSL